MTMVPYPPEHQGAAQQNGPTMQLFIAADSCPWVGVWPSCPTRPHTGTRGPPDEFRVLVMRSLCLQSAASTKAPPPGDTPLRADCRRFLCVAVAMLVECPVPPPTPVWYVSMSAAPWGDRKGWAPQGPPEPSVPVLHEGVCYLHTNVREIL